MVLVGNTSKYLQAQKGFTIVEVVVTLIVLAIFLTMFFRTYIVLEAQRLSVARQAIASDVAYSNLRKFTAMPAGTTCSTSGTSLTFTPEAVDTSTHITAQTVKAYPTNGCDGTNFYTDASIKLESEVIFDGGKRVVHASFVR